jgi:hypothetical protein
VYSKALSEARLVTVGDYLQETHAAHKKTPKGLGANFTEFKHQTLLKACFLHCGLTEKGESLISPKFSVLADEIFLYEPFWNSLFSLVVDAGCGVYTDEKMEQVYVWNGTDAFAGMVGQYATLFPKGLSLPLEETVQVPALNLTLKTIVPPGTKRPLSTF